MDTLIKNGLVVTATDTYTADVAISGGKISQVGADIAAPAGVRVIDARGKYVMPGAIDVHVHLQLPFCGTVSADDFENGTKAGACGGVTTVIDYAIQQKGHSLWEAIEARRREADPKVCVDYGLHAGITDWGIAGKEMDDVVKYGIPTFKMFMVYKAQGWMAEDSDLIQALEGTARNGGMLTVHAENDSAINLLIDRNRGRAKELGAYGHALCRPNYTEYEAIRRAILWAEVTGGRLYIVHMSTGEGADAVKDGRDRGVDVHAETCPQYLLLDDERFKGPDGHLYGTCPQLRKPADQARLWRALADGTVQVLATDTCTFNTTQKAMWGGDFTKIPFGMPGVETMLPLAHTCGVGAARFSLNRLVQVCCTNPAKLFGLYPNKGTLAVGADADVVVFDPDRKVTLSHKNLQTNCDWSPFEGFELKGYPAVTLSRGRVVAENGKFVGEVGHGRFVQGHAWGKLD
jgi:dihydropyrimidinase